ncbi:hypothetical protein [Paraliobacillus salinarum]|uniref:hypothetical protein n=1 Tax=Paraliobacillus salinarum TaxID=1158996 RepID=UPI0015F3B0E0|nr:hypothetical protein [Paraliobacillus salinarum]
MKKNLLAKGMIVGAVVGGALTLLDRDTRMSVKGKLKNVNQKTTFFMTHPSDFVSEVRNQYETVSRTMLDGFDTAIALISKFEKTVEQIEEKRNIN